MIINHNLPGMNAINKMNANSATASKSMQKLSSGLRINSAADDAAGLAISEKMRGQIRGLDQASANAQDGISMTQTAEGALSETESILQRMRELAVQSSNGTNTGADRSAIQDEVNQLADEINRIGNTTEFNTQKLINGSKDKTVETSAKKDASSIAKIGTGTDLFTVRNAATAGSGVGAAVTGAVTINKGTAGTYTSGVSGSLTNISTTLSSEIVNDKNELTVKIGNTVRTIVLDTASVTDGDVATDLQTKLRAAFKAGPAGGTDSGLATTDADNISVAISGGKLVIADGAGNKGADSKISIVGGNAAKALFNGSDVAANGNAANNTMVVNYTKDGGENTLTANLTLADGTYNTPDKLAAAIQAAFDAQNTVGGVTSGDVTFTADATLGSSIKIGTTTTGKGNGVTSMTGIAAGVSGLANATLTSGKDKNNTITVNVDGNNYTATIAEQDYSDKDVLANAIQSAINAQISGAGKDNLISVKTLAVADTDRIRFEVTSSKTGSGSNITFTSTGLADDLGFNTTAAKGQDGADASVSFQIGANKDQNLSLSISDMRSAALGITGSDSGDSTVTKNDGTVNDVTYGTSTVVNGTKKENVIDVSTAASSNKAIDIIDNATAKVSAERSKLGAYQNRLDHTINNLGTSSENLTSAESRIRDVDMAKEMSTFSKNNILSQAAQAMLAQANTQPQQVLQLLR